jgi:hypothetical protein
MSEWRDISTAPSGEHILVWCADSHPSTINGEVVPLWIVFKYDDGDFAIEHDGDGGSMDWQGLQPTHWRPMIEGPEA